MYKKIAVFVMALVMVLSFAACKGGDTGVSLSAEEIVQNAMQAMENVKTYRFEMDMDIDFSGEIEGEVYNATISMGAEGKMDIESERVEMNMVMNLVYPGYLDMEAEVDTYLIDGMLYESVIMPGIIEEAEWQKMPMPEGYWEDIEQIEPQLELLELAQVEVTGTESVGGIECHVMELTPNFEQIWQILEQQMTMGEMDDELGFDMETLEDMFKEFSVKQWVAKDTFFITKAELDMLIEVDIGDIEPSEEGVITMEMAMSLLAYDYNQPISIVLPEGAEEAELVDIY